MERLKMRVPFLDLRVSQDERAKLLKAIDQVFIHGRFILGPEVSELESTIAKYCKRKYAVGVSSGSDALYLALRSLNVGPGDEVITTTLSWIATTNAIALTGATPVFADIGDDLNIDPASVEKLITSRTKVLIPVHYTGKICNMKELLAIAKSNSIYLIEDGAQAFGAEYYGQVAGSFGDVACFSMNPMKIFAACGEAGMVLTDSQEIYDRLTALRYNGTINKETCVTPSLNYRLDTIQAAMLLKRFNNLDSIISKRRTIAQKYHQALQTYVRVPIEAPNSKDIYYTYTIQNEKRDELKKFLEERGIEVKIQHPFLMCQQAIYRKFLIRPVPNAERRVREILCIPAHENLTPDEQEYVIGNIKEYFS